MAHSLRSTPLSKRNDDDQEMKMFRRSRLSLRFDLHFASTFIHPPADEPCPLSSEVEVLYLRRITSFQVFMSSAYPQRQRIGSVLQYCVVALLASLALSTTTFAFGASGTLSSTTKPSHYSIRLKSSKKSMGSSQSSHSTSEPTRHLQFASSYEYEPPNSSVSSWLARE